MSKKSNNGFTLIEILVVMGIIAVLAAVVLIAINPARQFAQANNSQRTSNVNTILNAVGQYIADNKGAIPAEITTTATDIGSAGIALCDDLVPKYIPSLPFDPKATVATCSGAYDTDYEISKDADGRITVSASRAELGATISVTR